MVMQERSRRLSEPLHWGRREKTVTATFVTIVVLALLGLGVYALSSGAPARADCISVSFPGTLGGNELKGCGEQARKICASGSFRGIQDELNAACTKAGFAFRRPG
jgi:hypothetical protein